MGARGLAIRDDLDAAALRAPAIARALEGSSRATSRAPRAAEARRASVSPGSGMRG